MPLEIATIFITSDKAAVLRKFEGRKFLQGFAPELGRTFQELEVRTVKDLTGIAYNAARSVIPIHKPYKSLSVIFNVSQNTIRFLDTEITSQGKLRNYGLESNITKINKSNLTGKVFIQDVEHETLYRKFGLIERNSVRLAVLLDRGTYFSFTQKSTGPKYSSDFIGPPKAPRITTLTGGTKDYKRSRDSNAEPGFMAVPKGSPTKGWIIEANKQKEDHFQRFLSTDKNIQAYTASL
jgi:hypothetical protein